MAIGPYSTPVQPAGFVSPLDLNIYAKGMMYKQELAEKNLKNITDTYNTIMSIPAYGPDKQKLAEIDQQFRQQISSMNFSNLGDMSTMSQIRGILGQYTTNADVLAIAKRGTVYQSMLKEKDEADKKNKIYVNRGMNQLNKYFSGSDYIQNVKFGNDGYIAPDAGEMMESVKKVVTPDVKIVPDGKGNYEQVKYYDPEKLKNAFNLVASNNPNWQKYHRDQIDEMLEGVNVADYGKQYYGNIVNTYQDAYNLAQAARDKTTDKKKAAEYQKTMDYYNSEIKNVKNKLDNPYFEHAFRDDLLSKSKQDDINKMAEALEFTEMGDLKMDENTKIKKQLYNDLYKMREKEFYDLMPYMSSEDRMKIGTHKEGEINIQGYKQIADAAKARTAAALNNPNITGSETIPELKGTYQNFQEAFYKEQDGKRIIVDSKDTKQRIVDVIKARPDLFPNIPSNVLATLNPNDIEISDDYIQIDQSNLPMSETYDITQTALNQAVQDTYLKHVTNPNPLDGTTTHTSSGASGLDAAANK